jgi:hypothetical protein
MVLLQVTAYSYISVDMGHNNAIQVQCHSPLNTYSHSLLMMIVDGDEDDGFDEVQF